MDFISEYLEYTSGSEVPTFFNRWAAISGIGALLGRQLSFPFINDSLYPNLYVMLIGTPGTRKNTAINTMRRLLVQAGYQTIAADKTTKEKFLMDLAGIDTGAEAFEGKTFRGGQRKSLDEHLAVNLWGEGDEDATTKPPAEVFIVAPEFNDFLGNGNIEFISLLGNLWDYSGIYKSRIKNGKSIAIPNPTISIVGGNTPTGFSLAFPTEIFGQGFFSRLLLIYGQPNGRKIAFPTIHPATETARIVKMLVDIKKNAVGEAQVSTDAKELLDKIYNEWKGIDDVRFDSYSNRRFTHLLKLVLSISAARGTIKIDKSIVIYANTVLTHTENLMPKALGEFGKSKDSDVNHKVLTILENTSKPLSPKEVFSQVRMDVDSISKLAVILQNLQNADKIFPMKGPSGNTGFIAKKRVITFENTEALDWSILTEEERNMI